MFGLGSPEARSPPDACCCSPTGSPRRRRSWWSACSTTSTAHATPDCCRDPRRGGASRRWSRSWRRRRWPACRWCSGSSPRRRCWRPSTRHRAGRRRWRVGRRRVRLGDQRRLQHPLRDGGDGPLERARERARRRPVARAAAGAVRGAGRRADRRHRCHRRRSRPARRSRSVPPRRRSIRTVDDGPPGDLARVQPAAAVVGGGDRRRRRDVRRACAGRRRAGAAATDAGVVERAATAATLRGLNNVADKVTGVVQSGSLPIYLGVILLTAAVVPGCTAAHRATGGRAPDLVDTPMHVPIAAVILGAAMAAAGGASAVHGGAVPRRRRLLDGRAVRDPGRTRPGAHAGGDRVVDDRAVRARAAAPARPLRVGARRCGASRSGSDRPGWSALTVFVLALAAGAEHLPTPASDAMVDRSLPDGDGRNVVNVILVDFRGLRHARRDHRAGGGGDRHGGARPCRASARHTPDDDRERRAAPSCRRRYRSCRDWSRSRCRCGSCSSVVMVGSLYLLFAGHNQPGGGFVGGIVAGAAIALRYISGGIDEVRKLSRGQPWLVLGGGVLIAGTDGAGSVAVRRLRARGRGVHDRRRRCSGRSSSPRRWRSTSACTSSWSGWR